MESSLKPHFHILAEPPFGRAKKIRVWINGDSSNKCFDVTLNPNDLRTWNTVLKYLTLTIHPPFGVIRKLICLSSRKAVTCFEELSVSEKYIALGMKSKLIIMKQGYKSSSEQEILKTKKTRRQFYSGDMNSINLQFLQDTKRRNLTVIHMVANGQSCQSPTKVVLNENDLAHWSFSLEFLSKILDIPEGIQHICTIFGDIVIDPFELQHGFLYVALPFNEKFEKIDYTSTFGRASNKSCYVLKIRKNNGPSRVYCPYKEKSKEYQKANYSGMKCPKKSDDKKDCRVLITEDIPESCRTTEIEDKKGEKGMIGIKDCCLAHDERNFWCRLKKYNPGCCEIQKLSVTPDQLNKINTSEEKNCTITEKSLNTGNSRPNERDSSPEKVCDDLNKRDPPEDPKPAEDKLSMDSIEDALVQATTPQHGDKILTHFSREDNSNSASIDKCSNTERSLTKEEKPNISENFSKYSQCSGSYKNNLQYENRESRGISTILSELNVYPDHQPKQRPSIYIKNRTDINVVGYSKHDKRYRNDDEKKSYDSSSLSESSLTTPVNGNSGKFDHVCCFCREARKPNVSKKQVSKSKWKGVGEQKDAAQVFIETRGEHSDFDEIFDENDKTPTNIEPRKNSDDLKKEKSKGNTISEEGLVITNDNIEKSHEDHDNIPTKPGSERPHTIPDNISSLDSKEAQQSSPRRQSSSSRNSAASAVQKIMKIIEDNIPFADLEQAEMMEKIMEKNVSSEQDQEHSSERKNSGRPQNSGTIPDDNIPSLESEEAQQSSPRRQSSSSRNSAASAVQKIMKIIEDNIPIADLEQAEKMEKKVSSEQDQEHSSELKSILRDHSSVRSQSLGAVPDDNIPSLDSEEAQQSSPRRKSSIRNSAASAVQKIMNIIENRIPFADSEQAEIMGRKVSSEQDQELSSERKSALQVSERLQNSGTTPDDSIPSLDSEKAQQSSPRRKSSIRNSAASAVQKIMKIIEDNIPIADLEQAEKMEKKVSSEQDQEHSSERKNILLDHPKTQNLASSLGHNDSPSISAERQGITSIKRSSKMCSGYRECQKGKCKLRNVKRIIEEVYSESECNQAQQSVSEERNVKRYSDAIMNVKKILEGSTAEISEVLSKVKEDLDKKKTDSTNLSDSSGEENTKAYLP